MARDSEACDWLAAEPVADRATAAAWAPGPSALVVRGGSSNGRNLVAPDEAAA
ncbi:hypothetical protein MOKP37_05840 [Mycobacterium avium subsp. hominissuis]